MRINEVDKPLSQTELDQLEVFADRLFAKVGIDVEFTRHFLSRVNDERNVKQITASELTRLFKQEYKKWGKPIAELGPDTEAVLKDLATDVNVPFALRWDSANNELDLVAKTVMRKKNFKTSNQEFAIQSHDYSLDSTQGKLVFESIRLLSEGEPALKLPSNTPNFKPQIIKPGQVIDFTTSKVLTQAEIDERIAKELTKKIAKETEKKTAKSLISRFLIKLGVRHATVTGATAITGPGMLVANAGLLALDAYLLYELVTQIVKSPVTQTELATQTQSIDKIIASTVPVPITPHEPGVGPITQPEPEADPLPKLVPQPKIVPIFPPGIGQPEPANDPEIIPHEPGKGPIIPNDPKVIPFVPPATEPPVEVPDPIKWKPGQNPNSIPTRIKPGWNDPGKPADEPGKPGMPVEPPAEKPKEKPAEKPKEKPAEKPKEKPAEKPKEKPAEKPKEKPAEKPKEKPAEKPKEKPAEKPKEKPAEKPKEKPAEKPKEKPKEKPAEKPKEKPAEKPKKKPEYVPPVQPDRHPDKQPDKKPEYVPPVQPDRHPDKQPDKKPEPTKVEPDAKPYIPPQTPGRHPDIKPATISPPEIKFVPELPPEIEPIPFAPPSGAAGGPKPPSGKNNKKKKKKHWDYGSQSPYWKTNLYKWVEKYGTFENENLITKYFVLNEGGAMPGVGTVHIDEIKPTLEQLEKSLGVDLQNNTLGSVGKKQFSGDIDVALKIAPEEIPAFIEALNKNPLVSDIRKTSVVMTKVKIQNFDKSKVDPEGRPRTGFVQVDFMPGDPGWLKTYYHTPHEDDSKYKGVYRNIMIATLAAVHNRDESDAKLEDGRAMETRRLMWSPTEGLLRVKRTPVPNKAGTGYTKKNKNETIDGPWKQPDEIAQQLGLDSGKDLNSFESLLKAMQKNWTKEAQKYVIDGFKDNKVVQDIGIPEELQ